MQNTHKEIQIALGISEGAAKLYLAALQENPATLTQLSRRGEISRTVIHKPLNELLELGILTQRPAGKRVHYYPIGPQDWPLITKRREQAAKELSHTLLQQISIPGDLQVKWHNGLSGIRLAVQDFFSKGSGLCRSFENAGSIPAMGINFVNSIVEQRLRKKIFNKIILVGDNNQNKWYEEHLKENKKELRDVVLISPHEYPFEADVATLGNMVLIMEYRDKPFGLSIENEVLAKSVGSIFDMVWDRYRGR